MSVVKPAFADGRRRSLTFADGRNCELRLAEWHYRRTERSRNDFGGVENTTATADGLNAKLHRQRASQLLKRIAAKVYSVEPLSGPDHPSASMQCRGNRAEAGGRIDDVAFRRMRLRAGLRDHEALALIDVQILPEDALRSE